MKNKVLMMLTCAIALVASMGDFSARAETNESDVGIVLVENTIDVAVTMNQDFVTVCAATGPAECFVAFSPVERLAVNVVIPKADYQASDFRELNEHYMSANWRSIDSEPTKTSSNCGHYRFARDGLSC